MAELPMSADILTYILAVYPGKSHPSTARHGAQARESSPVKDQRSNQCVTPPTMNNIHDTHYYSVVQGTNNLQKLRTTHSVAKLLTCQQQITDSIIVLCESSK